MGLNIQAASNANYPDELLVKSTHQIYSVDLMRWKPDNRLFIMKLTINIRRNSRLKNCIY